MTVFLVHPIRQQPPGPQWGQPFYMNKRFVYPDEILEDHTLPPGFLDHLQRSADRFIPGTDFFAMTGDYLQLAAFNAMLAVRHPHYDILTFDRKTQAYVWSRISSGLEPDRRPVLGSTTDTGVLNAEDRKQDQGRFVSIEEINAQFQGKR